MLDRWEAMLAEVSADRDSRLVEILLAAQGLADEMCSAIFDRMGLTVVRDDKSLTVSGRGLRYVFPLRGDNVPLKYDNHNKGRRKKVLLPRPQRLARGEQLR